MPTVVVDPVTRIEGHLRIEVETDANNVITQAYSSGTSFRGIEIILKNRDPREAWAFTQRFCGVCTVSNSIASVRAVESALNYSIPINGQLIRNLMMGTQYVHDHVMHFYHLHALDWIDVVSALKADPAKVAALQQELSAWPNNSAGYFTEVKQKLSDFVNSGQLGIFTNGYWGHAAYKCPPEVNLMAFAHYLEALSWQRDVAKVIAIFGGKNPHPMFAVGGAACAIDPTGASGKMAVTNATLAQIKQLIFKMQEFVDQVYLPDTLAVGACYKDWGVKGHGEGLGNFMTFGEFPLTANTNDANSLFVPRGAILNRDLTTIHPVDLEDLEQIQEFVERSWYDYSVGTDEGLHPYVGETNPVYTGPTHAPFPNHQPFASVRDGTDPAYSWLKTPRWRRVAGEDPRPMEVGPLARVLMMYADPGAPSHQPTQEVVNLVLETLKLPPGSLFSTLGRLAARTIEAKVIADKLLEWHNQLTANIAAGDRTTHNGSLWHPNTWPVRCQGVGFQEAPRGALAHWLTIQDAKIENYQAIIPTTWNGSPKTRFDDGGAFEAALRGHTLADPEKPIEILRTIHSFDPCLACAVHVIDPDGEELVQVKVR